MKTLKILVLFLVVLSLNGDTLLSVRQIQPCPTSCILASVAGTIEWVEGTVGGGGSAPSWVQRVELVTAPKADWVLLNAIAPGSLDVVRNGSVLSPGVDFNLSGRTVSFLGVHVPQPGDVLRFKYQTP
jgi:hypothetical protein